MKPEDDGIEKLKGLGDKNVVKCRTCGNDHWTTKCPWKDTVLADDKKPPMAAGKIVIFLISLDLHAAYFHV